MTTDAKTYTYIVKGSQRPGYPAITESVVTGLTLKEFNEFKELQTFDLKKEAEKQARIEACRIKKPSFVFKRSEDWR